MSAFSFRELMVPVLPSKGAAEPDLGKDLLKELGYTPPDAAFEGVNAPFDHSNLRQLDFGINGGGGGGKVGVFDPAVKPAETPAACDHCTYCTNCTNCSDCTMCTACSNCTGCTFCTQCTHCTYSSRYEKDPESTPKDPDLEKLVGSLRATLKD